MLSKTTGWLAGLILNSMLALQAMAAPDPQAGQLLLTGTEAAAVHLETAIALQVQGLEAEVVMTQRFQNQSDEWVDGVYVFPLAESSAVKSLQMRVGERVIVGEIQERQQARAQFEAARTSGQKATLVEQHRPNLFRQELANIAPGETVEIRLGYSQSVTWSSGQFRLRLPTTLTPRYIPGITTAPEPGPMDASLSGWAPATDQVNDAPWITPPQRPVGADRILNPLTLTGVLKPGTVLAHIDSETHALAVEQNGSALEYHFQLVDGPVSMDRDVELSWTAVTGSEPVVLAFTETWQDAAYLQLLLMPPPALEARERLPRELVLVVDTSGSMAGMSIVQARESALMALERLQPTDRFNVLLFDSTTRSIFDESVPATAANLDRARLVLQGMQASGGTEMFSALSRALAHSPKEEHLQQIVFVTDGSVANEAALLALIHKQLGKARLFMVAIGSAPNHFFMRRAAAFGRGSFTDIAQLAQVRERMGELLKKLESPLITDLQIHWPWDVDMYPERVPDLYWGEPLRVVARVPAGFDAPAVIRVSGASADSAWVREVNVAPSRQPAPGAGAVATMPVLAQRFGREKITALENRFYRGEDREQAQQSILPVALAYQLMSPYTSLVAIDRTPARTSGESVTEVAVANALPAGTAMRAMGYPQTDAGFTWHLLMGGLALTGLALLRLAGNDDE